MEFGKKLEEKIKGIRVIRTADVCDVAARTGIKTRRLDCIIKGTSIANVNEAEVLTNFFAKVEKLIDLDVETEKTQGLILKETEV